MTRPQNCPLKGGYVRYGRCMNLAADTPDNHGSILLTDVGYEAMSRLVAVGDSGTLVGGARKPVPAGRMRIDEAGWCHAIVYVQITRPSAGDLIPKNWPCVVSLPPGSVLGIRYASNHSADPLTDAEDDKGPAGAGGE